MTLSELQAISAECKTDAEFLAHVNVRQVWWGIVEPGKKFKHRFGQYPGIDGPCKDCGAEAFVAAVRAAQEKQKETP